MNKVRVYIFLTTAVLLTLLMGNAKAQMTTKPKAALTPPGIKTTKDLAFSAANAPDHKILFKYLKASGLTKQAAANGQYTVFAPTDAAFSALPDADQQELLLPSAKKKLIQFLAYHVVKGRMTSNQLKDGQTLTNLTGQILLVHKQGNTITVEDGRGTVADVTQADIRTSNGVVYSINKVLQRIVQ